MKACEICSPGAHMIRSVADLEHPHPAPLPEKVIDALSEQFPEAAKWSAICDTGANMVVQDFLDWLEKRGMVLCVYNANDRPIEVDLTSDKLIYRFFEVDERALEKDRRDMLKLAFELGETG